MDPLGEAVEQGGGKFLVGEDTDPLAEGEIGGQDRAAALMAVGQEIEEQLAAIPAKGHEPQFVDDQQFGVMKPALEPAQFVAITGLRQLAHQIGGPDEGHGGAPAGRLDPQADGQMRLAGADRADDHDVFGLFHELAGGQIQDLLPADALQGVPVELLERLEVGEARLAQQPLGGMLVAGADFHIQQFHEVVFVAPTAVLGASRHRPVFTGQGGRLQLPAVLTDDGLDHVGMRCVVHATPSSNTL